MVFKVYPPLSARNKLSSNFTKLKIYYSMYFFFFQDEKKEKYFYGR